jgi:hypothetical protein
MQGGDDLTKKNSSTLISDFCIIAQGVGKGKHMAVTDIPNEIKQRLLDAITLSLYENEIAYRNERVFVDVYHTYVRIPIRLARASDIEKAVKLTEQMRFNICNALLLPASVNKNVILRSSSTYLIVEIARDNPDLPTALDLEQDAKELYTLGFAGDLHLQYRLFGSQEAGVACLGTTGSGKSNTIRLILALALSRDVECHLIDYKGGDSFRKDLGPLCASVVYDDPKALALLTRLHRLAKDRNHGKARKDKRVLIIIEEIYLASKTVKEIVAEMMGVCRSANIRIVIGSQRFGEEIPPQLKENVRTRIVHKVVSKGESFNCTQIKGALAERLPGRGAVIIVTGDGTLTRGQIANADVPYLSSIVQKILDAREPKMTSSEKPLIQQTKQKRTVRRTMTELKKTTKSKANFPPVWTFYFARVYFQQNNKAPSYHYLNEKRKRINSSGEKFKTISKAQTRLISEFCHLGN